MWKFFKQNILVVLTICLLKILSKTLTDSQNKKVVLDLLRLRFHKDEKFYVSRRIPKLIKTKLTKKYSKKNNKINYKQLK